MRLCLTSELCHRKGLRRGSSLAVCVSLILLFATTAAPSRAQPADASTEAAEPLGQTLHRLDKREFDVERALASARLDLVSAERRFASAQEQLDAAVEPEPALREELSTRRLQLSSMQRIVELLEERIERLQADKRAFRRLADLRSRLVPAETITEWGADSERELDAVTRNLAVKKDRVEELRQELAFTRERTQTLPTTSPSERWLRLQSQVLEELLRHYEDDIEALEAARDLEAELSLALESESEQLPLSARLRSFLYHVRAVWNYELTGSEQEPITPGKIVSALVIFLIGYVLAGAVARLLGRRVFPRLRLEAGAAQAFQSLAFYFLLLIAFLTALRMVQIPLTAFAVLGGALAIGVGFGSQNVVNNFMSGLILLAERPIKLGDLIEVENVYGTVEQIGLRSTRVRTGDNIHIIVPNASFLESKLVNWTHTDPRVRIIITVGVVYGSPTREAERLILKALEEHPLVLREPEPVVLFRDFGDNALVFETRFWIEMRTMMDRMRIESDIRFGIDDLFREAGIVIAFPQRDVHLDTPAPIEVRVVERSAKDDVAET